MAHEEKLYEKCVQIYEADGQSAVIEYCNKIGHKTWGKCKPCDSDHSPIMDDNFMTCLVCGHSTYHEIKEFQLVYCMDIASIENSNKEQK